MQNILRRNCDTFRGYEYSTSLYLATLSVGNPGVDVVIVCPWLIATMLLLMVESQRNAIVIVNGETSWRETVN